MTKIIGFTFVLACPFFFGIFIPIGVAVHFNLDIDTCTVIYCIVWALMFAGWFDGSKYQDIF